MDLCALWDFVNYASVSRVGFCFRFDCACACVRCIFDLLLWCVACVVVFICSLCVDRGLLQFGDI